MIKLTEMNCDRGAPMGRRDNYVPGIEGAKFYLERIPFVDGDYDCGGAYWGSGETLWLAKDEDPPECDEQIWKFVRARDRESAMFIVKESYPGSTFRPETGSIIQQTTEFLQKYQDGMVAKDEWDQDCQDQLDELQEELDRIKADQARLTQIIKETAGRLKDVDVDIDRSMGTVAISSSGKEDIFMQGDDAEQFIKEVDKMYEDASDVTEDEAALCVASPYCENLWS